MDSAKKVMNRRAPALALTCSLATACVGGNGAGSMSNTPSPPPAVLNNVALTVDTGPAAAPGAYNHAYVTVKLCTPGSATQCATIDHVLLDTGSAGLRIVRSVLNTSSIVLPAATDAESQAIHECMSFSGGQTWGPIVHADLVLAGETASGLALQLMDDTSTGIAPPSACGANGTLVNGVSGFSANGILGVGVLAQDCGSDCAAPATPLPVYYGCTTAGVCTAENLPAAQQVTNPVVLFAHDNNGVIVTLPALQNANGDISVQGQLTFGIATQTDNALPDTGLTVLGADAHGDFTTMYNGGSTALPSLIDSGVDSYSFGDPTIAVCDAGTAPAFVGYYCPAAAPLSLSGVNSGVGTNNGTNTVQFALQNPDTFLANAAAFAGLGSGGGASTFTWGLPFFYGRKVYLAIEEHAAGAYTGPYYAY